MAKVSLDSQTFYTPHSSTGGTTKSLSQKSRPSLTSFGPQMPQQEKLGHHPTGFSACAAILISSDSESDYSDFDDGQSDTSFPPIDELPPPTKHVKSGTAAGLLLDATTSVPEGSTSPVPRQTNSSQAEVLANLPKDNFVPNIPEQVSEWDQKHPFSPQAIKRRRQRSSSAKLSPRRSPVATARGTKSPKTTQDEQFPKSHSSGWDALFANAAMETGSVSGQSDASSSQQVTETSELPANTNTPSSCVSAYQNNINVPKSTRKHSSSSQDFANAETDVDRVTPRRSKRKTAPRHSMSELTEDEAEDSTGVGERHFRCRSGLRPQRSLFERDGAQEGDDDISPMPKRRRTLLTGTSTPRHIHSTRKRSSRHGMSSRPCPQDYSSDDGGDSTHATEAVFNEWPLRDAVLKHVVIDGTSTFQLQFTWNSCASHKQGHKQKVETLYDSDHLSPRRQTRARVPWDNEEETLLTELKEQGLAWNNIYKIHKETFPQKGRKVGSLQVRYCTKLKRSDVQ